MVLRCAAKGGFCNCVWASAFNLVPLDHKAKQNWCPCFDSWIEAEEGGPSAGYVAANEIVEAVRTGSQPPCVAHYAKCERLIWQNYAEVREMRY